MSTYICSIPYRINSINNAILYVPVYKSVVGYKGLFYIIDGFRYYIRFPIKWALDHKVLSGNVSGPKECLNCAMYGTCCQVFVGYCDNCLRNYVETNESRGDYLVKTGHGLDGLNNEERLQKYPYIKEPIIGIILSEEYEMDEVNSVWVEIAENIIVEGGV